MLLNLTLAKINQLHTVRRVSIMRLELYEFSSPALCVEECEDSFPRHCYSHIKGLVSSSVQWIVSEYIMKVPGSLVNGREVRIKTLLGWQAALKQLLYLDELLQALAAFCVAARMEESTSLCMSSGKIAPTAQTKYCSQRDQR